MTLILEVVPRMTASRDLGRPKWAARSSIVSSLARPRSGAAPGGYLMTDLYFSATCLSWAMVTM